MAKVARVTCPVTYDVAGRFKVGPRQSEIFDTPLYFNRFCIYSVSGMVNGQVYYCDAAAFYERHCGETEDMRQGWEDNMEEPIRIQGDLKNFLAWFAFEQVAYHMTLEMGLD